MLTVESEHPDKVQAVTEMHDGQVVDVGPETITVEITGEQGTIDNAIETFERFGVREIVRTGSAALAAGVEETA
jgi:acetolactate synthase-1/3 small subunit